VGSEALRRAESFGVLSAPEASNGPPCVEAGCEVTALERMGSGQGEQRAPFRRWITDVEGGLQRPSEGLQAGGDVVSVQVRVSAQGRRPRGV